MPCGNGGSGVGHRMSHAQQSEMEPSCVGLQLPDPIRFLPENLQGAEQSGGEDERR